MVRRSSRAWGSASGGVLLAGVCGALIGSSLVNLQCQGRCVTASGIGAVVGGLAAAAGVAVVAVLVLRAMGEWRTIKEQGPPEASAEDVRRTR